MVYQQFYLRKQKGLLSSMSLAYFLEVCSRKVPCTHVRQLGTDERHLLGSWLLHISKDMILKEISYENLNPLTALQNMF